MGKTWLIPYLLKVHFDDGSAAIVAWDNEQFGKPWKGQQLARWAVEQNGKQWLKGRQIAKVVAFSQRTRKTLVTYEVKLIG